MSWPRTPLPSPVTADAQAEYIATFIEQEYTKERGGVSKVVESMWHLWEEILMGNDTPRVLVCCTGEIPRGGIGEQDWWVRVDRQWTVVVLRGHGLRNLEKGEEGVPPNTIETLNQSIEGVRNALRRMTGISEEFPITYKGWKNLPPVARPGMANVFVAGATIDFSTANDIGEARET